MSNLLEKIAMASQKTVKIPKGAYSRHEWQRRWGKSEPQACRLLKAAVAAGLMKVKVFRVMTPIGARAIPHYWEVK